MEEEKKNEIELETEEERQRRLRRRKRIEEMQREKRKAQLRQKCVIPAAVIAAAALVICIAVNVVNRPEESELPQKTEESAASMTESESGENGNSKADSAEQPDKTDDSDRSENIDTVPVPLAENVTEPEVYGPFPTETPREPVFEAVNTFSTAGFEDSIVSQYGVLIDVEQGTILAQKEAKTRINPASMTKILTVLTAADALGITGENWENSDVLKDTFTITIEITDYSYVNDCSNVGFEVGEEVTVRDLFYGTVLPSGGDAALGLACYVAGSHEAFVELMNKKLEELELSESTHFTNCVGLYDKEHYSTVYDMAVLLKTAADNPFCREVLSAHTYNTSQTAEHPEGLLISNWFLRRIEDKDTHGEVLCGKTGYVLQSGSCAASLATDGAGREYLCVTAGSSSSWQCIYDQVALYQKYLASE
ncbi:MAG: D-alanyl-D-alanine carboxypeptidase family protein [Acetatifactor sp.]